MGRLGECPCLRGRGWKLQGQWLPCVGGGKLRSTGLVPLRKALSCLQRVAPKGPGVEGTRCVFLTARKDETPHIRHGLRPMTPSPWGEGYFSETIGPYF